MAKHGARASVNVRQDSHELTAQQRGYDWKWRTFAKKYLASHPVCARCGQPAEVVDHIIPSDVWMKAQGRFEYNENYYQPLCQACNKRKGRREDRIVRKEFEKDIETLDIVVTPPGVSEKKVGGEASTR